VLGRDRLQRGALAAAPDEDPDQPGGEEGDAEERSCPELARAAAPDVAVFERVDAVADDERRETDHGVAAVAVGSDRVRGDAGGDDQLDTFRGVRGRERLDQHSAQHEARDEQRPVAAERERESPEQRERSRQPRRAGHRVERPHVPLGDRGDRDDDRQIERKRGGTPSEAQHGPEASAVSSDPHPSRGESGSSSRPNRIVPPAADAPRRPP
jgi:hypothetical protein